MSIALVLGLVIALAIVVLLLYVVSRVSRLEDVTNAVLERSINSSASLPSADTSQTLPFRGLSGKQLWDNITGGQQKLDETELEEVRERYEIVLKKHIQSLVQAGYGDAAFGAAKNNPSSSKAISTLRGKVTSWIPPQHSAALYNAAFDLGHSSTDSDKDRIAQAIDETVRTLFEECLLPYPVDFSTSLLEQFEKDNDD
jgi:hypothetical protein